MTLRALALAGACLAGCRPSCETGLICAVAGTGELGFNGDGLPADETRLASPTAVGVTPEGAVLVVDYSNMRVRVLGDDGVLRTVVGNGIHAYSEPGANALATPLENPVDAVFGADGLLYVQPQHEGRVVRVTDADTIEIIAGTGVLSDGADGVSALDAEMGYGAGMAYAADGTLFISDTSFSRVRRVGPDGVVDTVLGTGSGEWGEPGFGPQTAIRFPERIAVDEVGDRLLVADTGNHRVLAVDLSSLAVTLVAGSGVRGDAGDDGPAHLAELDNPVGVLATPAGDVLIADLGNDRVRLVGADGVISTVAGGGERDATVAEPLALHMRGPAGMAWTHDGDLLVAERSGHRVLRWLGALDAL